MDILYIYILPTPMLVISAQNNSKVLRMKSYVCFVNKLKCFKSINISFRKRKSLFMYMYMPEAWMSALRTGEFLIFNLSYNDEYTVQ